MAGRALYVRFSATIGDRSTKKMPAPPATYDGRRYKSAFISGCPGMPVLPCDRLWSRNDDDRVEVHRADQRHGHAVPRRLAGHPLWLDAGTRYGDRRGHIVARDDAGHRNYGFLIVMLIVIDGWGASMPVICTSSRSA